MRDRLIELIKDTLQEWDCDVLDETILQIADHLIANNVFVLPEKLKDSWELALPFLMRLFATDEEQIEKVHREFERKKVKQILTDFRDYIYKEWDNAYVDEEPIFTKALADLTEYAEKLGVEL